MRNIINLVEGRQTPAQRFCATLEARLPRNITASFNPEDSMDVSLQRLSVPSNYRGEGLASQVMVAATKLADRMGVTIHLEAHPDDDDDEMDEERLVGFYKRFGFQGGDTPGNRMMYREPRGRKGLTEIELGGELDSSFVDDLDKKDLSSDQLDLFEPTTTGQPRVPANMELVGRTGVYYVAKRTGPLPGHEQKKDEHVYVFIKDNKAAGYICLYPWSGEHVNYPHQAAYQPDLHGNGLRTAAVMVLPEFRGQQLGPTMYKWVLENVCDYIIADSTHTQGGAALWKQMRSMRGVFAVEIWNAEKYETQPRWHKHVYSRDHYIPWITLRGREDKIRTGSDDE